MKKAFIKLIDEYGIHKEGVLSSMIKNLCDIQKKLENYLSSGRTRGFTFTCNAITVKMIKCIGKHYKVEYLNYRMISEAIEVLKSIQEKKTGK